MKIQNQICLHQMVIDRIEDKEYVIQNTDPAEEIRIPLSRELYVGRNEYLQSDQNTVVTDFCMEEEELYLCRNAFSVEIKTAWLNKKKHLDNI